MKRVLSVLLCMVFLLGFIPVFASASSADDNRTATSVGGSNTRMSYINCAAASIGISGGKVISVGDLEGYKGITTKVEITLTIQRRASASNLWSDWYNYPKQTFNSHRGTASCSKDAVKGYQYRTKADFVAWAGSSYEAVTVYSGYVSY